jgi:excisionase family DNA binding protein
MRYRASDYLALPEVAKTLGCSRQTVYRLIEAGELEGLQLRDHGWWRVLGRSLDNYVARRTKRPAPAAGSVKRVTRRAPAAGSVKRVTQCPAAARQRVTSSANQSKGRKR